MEENAKLEIPGWSSLLLLAYLRQELWERGYDSLSAEGSQTPTTGSRGLCQICPILIDRLPVLPTSLTATPFIPSLQLTELSLSIWFTGAKSQGLCRITGGTSLLVWEAASLAMGDLLSFNPHLLPFLPPLRTILGILYVSLGTGRDLPSLMLSGVNGTLLPTSAGGERGIPHPPPCCRSWSLANSKYKRSEVWVLFPVEALSQTCCDRAVFSVSSYSWFLIAAFSLNIIHKDHVCYVSNQLLAGL